jgi:hypothetical protein
MNGQKTLSKPHPYSVDDIPQFKIDYKGLIKYTESVHKSVAELSDEEKELFTNGVSMSEIRNATKEL